MSEKYLVEARGLVCLMSKYGSVEKTETYWDPMGGYLIDSSIEYVWIIRWSADVYFIHRGRGFENVSLKCNAREVEKWRKLFEAKGFKPLEL